MPVVKIWSGLSPVSFLDEIIYVSCGRASRLVLLCVACESKLRAQGGLSLFVQRGSVSDDQLNYPVDALGSWRNASVSVLTLETIFLNVADQRRGMCPDPINTESANTT